MHGPTQRDGTVPFRDGTRFFKISNYRLKIALRDPTVVVGILAALLFSYLIVAPIVSLLADAFRVQFADAARVGQDVGSLTLYNLGRVFKSIVAPDILWFPLVHTLSVALGAMAIALVVGGTMAWFISRTDIMGRKWFATALIVPYMLPSWTLALAWSSVFLNRTVGGQPGWLESMGFEPPDWLAYGQLPITIVLALHYTPFVILLFGNALRSFDAQMEDAGRMLGAGPSTVARRIIIPLMRPSLLSAVTLIFAKCLGDFGVAYVLGAPVKYDVLATSLFRSVTARQGGEAAVLAGVIILIGSISVLIDARLVREARRFVTIGTKGGMDRTRSLGTWRLPITAIAGLVFVISVAIPLTVLFLTTVMRTPGKFTLDNFTWDYWVGHDLPTTALRDGILITADFWHAAWNSLWMVGIAAICAGVLGVLVGYVVVRTPLRSIGGYLRYVTFLPYLVPGIAFAAACLSIFAVPHGPIPALYGTAAILILALMADQMPFASRAGISAMMQLGKDPEEAAQVAGAGWWKRLLKVVIPIQKGPLAAAILLPFISGLKGLSLVIMLATPGTDLLTTYAIRLVDFGYSQAANAVVLMLSALAFFGTLFLQKATKTSLASGLGG
ncbi:ABC transporter permease [Allopusillimonas ginsengisoli]|uniref:ABC transporter permease n=1 Tax=Allopusillimonas ginsengisoli TaxID=453575 RepID=UPI0010C20461|nr:iron ABC transporter permease [Allopusillimonas ginsengisoli]